MEWLRKRVQDCRVKVRTFVNRNWHNDPEGDIYRSLDIMLLLGAVRYRPTQKWRRICWNTHRVLAACSTAILVLNFLDQMLVEFDLLKVTWHATVTSVAVLCFVKDSVLNRSYESIEMAQKFINSKPFGSGDTLSDSNCRKKLFKRLQLTALVLLVVMLMNTIVFICPFLGISELLGTPRIIQLLGPKFAAGIHVLFLLTYCTIWLNKYCAGTGTICSLLHGFKTEYEIYVRGFGKLQENVFTDVEEKIPSTLQAEAEWKLRRRDELYWMCLEQRVTDQVKLHVQFVENLQLLEPVAKHLFAIIYYNAMIVFSPLIYVGMFSGLSGTSLLLASGIALNLADCYVWSSTIESFQDINETLELEIMDLITKIPHSPVHHEKYAEIRTTLCIMKTFVRNHEPFSCGGVFPITVEAFADLLNIGYTVFTFLKDMGGEG